MYNSIVETFGSDNLCYCKHYHIKNKLTWSKMKLTSICRRRSFIKTFWHKSKYIKAKETIDKRNNHLDWTEDIQTEYQKDNDEY